MKIQKKITIFLFIAAIALCYGIISMQQRWSDSIQWIIHLPPCLRIGGELHHYYEPNCSGSFSFYGEKVFYSINEDGIRERSAALIRQRQVLVLGDSMVEGWGIQAQETIPARLEEAWRNKSPMQFINAGYRFTGPIMQALRAEKLIKKYKPKLLLWFITENDLLDDQFSYSLAKAFDVNGMPKKFSTSDFDNVSWVNRYASLQNEFPVAFSLFKYFAYQRSVNQVLKNQDWQKQYHVCAGIEYLSKIATANHARTAFVAIPMGSVSNTDHRVSNIDSLIMCTKKFPLVDLRNSTIRDPKNYLYKNTHFNPRGTSVVAAAIEESVASLLSKIK